MAHNGAQRTRLEQGITAVQTGDLDTGKRLLAQVLTEEPQNEEAWLWLSTAVDDLTQRTECLRRVLVIDPENKMAWERLAALTSENPAHDRLSLNDARPLAFPCPQCGGELHYHIEHQNLVCDHCGHEVSVDKEPAAQNEYPLAGMLGSRQGQADVGGTLAVKCDSCGSTTTFSARSRTVECPFCGTEIMLEESPGTPVILPQAVIPFQVNEKRARATVHQWWGEGWFRPLDLAKESSVIRIHGVYIPFWTFDGMAVAKWIESESEFGERREIAKDRLLLFDDLLVCGSYTMLEKTALGLEPFDTKVLVLYHPEFLAGWPAEVSQLSLADASIRARERMAKEARAQAPLGARVGDGNLDVFTYKHVLLPVWVGVYSYQGQLYHFAINGQTGKVSGMAPRSLTNVLRAGLLGSIVLPLLAIVLASSSPDMDLRRMVVLGSAAFWLVILAAYVISKNLGWWGLDVSEAHHEHAASPEKRGAVIALINRLSK